LLSDRGSIPLGSTKKNDRPLWAVILFGYDENEKSNESNTARMSDAGDGRTEPLHTFHFPQGNENANRFPSALPFLTII